LPPNLRYFASENINPLNSRADQPANIFMEDTRDGRIGIEGKDCAKAQPSDEARHQARKAQIAAEAEAYLAEIKRIAADPAELPNLRFESRRLATLADPHSGMPPPLTDRAAALLQVIRELS